MGKEQNNMIIGIPCVVCVRKRVCSRSLGHPRGTIHGDNDKVDMLRTRMQASQIACNLSIHWCPLTNCKCVSGLGRNAMMIEYIPTYPHMNFEGHNLRLSEVEFCMHSTGRWR